MNAPALLIAASAGILLTLGTLHLVFTFYGDKLLPRDATLIPHMQQTHMVITRETTVWKAWIGFNASHSMSAMLFGLFYGWLALMQPALLFGSPFLIGLGLATLGGFCVLGKLYWFSVPFAGICLALGAYLTAFASLYVLPAAGG